MPRRLLAVALVALGLSLATAPAALAQDADGSTTSVTVDGPAPADIIPRPNVGDEPQEAGDRGGALQLGLLAAVLVMVGGAVWHLVAQSRRARGMAP